MIEVEKKVWLDSSARARLEKLVGDRGGEFSPPHLEQDIYFRKHGFRKRIQTRADYLVRVRSDSRRQTLNLKTLSERPGVVCEFETEIANLEATKQILLLLGAEHACDISKNRSKARLDGVDLLLDDVAQLGAFLELSIETADESQVEAAVARIDALIQVIGVNTSQIEVRGYPDIVLENQGVVFNRS